MSRVKYIRKQVKLSQCGLAKTLQCSQTTLSALERGVFEASPDLARRLIRFAHSYGFELTYSDIYGDPLLEIQKSTGNRVLESANV